jgi:CRP/FNR family transcriptional regulator
MPAHIPPIAVLSGPHVACRHCSLFALCLPVGVGHADLELLERVIKRRRLLKRGGHLFRSGDRFHSVFAVKSGSIKTYLTIGPQDEKVTGFMLPGELLGLDAIGTGHYQASARALEDSSFCEVPFDRLEELAREVPSMQQQMLRIMSSQLRHDQQMQVLHCKKCAPARLAAFLVGLSTRLAGRGLSAAEFRLSMSRDDIASYVGLAKETVIRLFAQFQQRELVSIRRRHLRIHDLCALQALAGPHACPP